MNNRYARLELTFLDKGSPGRPSSENCFVDVVLDGNDKIVGRWELYGRWTENDTASEAKTFPMTIKLDGEIRFGPDGHDGYSTNLRDRVMRVGEIATFWGDTDRGGAGGFEWSYRVARIIDLLAGAPA